MQKVKDIVLNIMQEIEKAKEDGCDIFQLEEICKKTLTKKEQKHIKSYYFKNGVLYLGIDSAPWKYNFNLKKEVLLRNLKEYLPALKEICFNIKNE